MKDEIKEILDRLERIDHKEYSCGFEFADSSSFDEVCRCFKERKKMADYITNLQQENERLNNMLNNADNKNLSLIEEINKKQDIIEKTVEYIKEHIQKYDIDGSIGDFDEFDMLTKPNYLLNILQNGSDEE